MKKHIAFQSRDNTVLTLFYISEAGIELRLFDIERKCECFSSRLVSPQGWYCRIPLEADSRYEMTYEGNYISYAYISGPGLKDSENITILDTEKECLCTEENFASFYDHPSKNQYHFSPLRNWMNDPNGLTYFNGRYHLFYQANPTSVKWGNMYWGHAISKDLLYWNHLPHALFPQDELKDRIGYKGGAYSGCAVSSKEEMKLYFTRCFSPLLRGPESIETQVEACFDGIAASYERTVIAAHPFNGGMDFNFRDPKVVTIDGIETMIIATTLNRICSVVAYQKNEVGAWCYMGPMLQDENADCQAFECANFIENAETGICALLCSLQDRPEIGWQRRLSKAYICRRKGLKLETIRIQDLDFGRGSYALQLFDGTIGRNISLAWCPDTYRMYRPEGTNSNGSLTIPHELKLDGSNLLITPFSGIEELKNEAIDLPASDHGEKEVSDMTFVWKLSFSGKSEMSLTLAENSSSRLSLYYQDCQLMLKYDDEKDSIPSPLAVSIAQLENLEIFVDRSVVEIFVNNGEAYGCLSYFMTCPSRRIHYAFSNPECIKNNQIRMLESIWKNRRKT